MYFVVVSIIESLKNTDTSDGRPAYERYAEVISTAIKDGQLKPGARLPTVRNLSTELGVSATTVMSMYARLAEGGYTTGSPGRGTFVAGAGPGYAKVPVGAAVPVAAAPGVAWRRQALAEAELRLRRRFPEAIDLTRGSPARDLLPIQALQRAWARAAETLTATQLQYPLTLTIDPMLSEALLPRLAADGIDPAPESLLAMNSTQHFLSTLAMVLTRAVAVRPPIVAVEEPGYQTAMDTFERAGCRLLGVPLDRFGATPDGVARAVAAGADAVLLTPRALSPTGATWTEQRRRELAEVLAPARHVWVVEDDYFAELAQTSVGSLGADPRLRDRTVYIRGFSKSISPDLRVAVGAVGANILPAMVEERSFCDGWTSSFTQRTLGIVLKDARLDDALQLAGATYQEARARFVEVLGEPLQETAGGEVERTDSGLHAWVRLPHGCRASDVVQRCASDGFLVTNGEPFFLAPGQRRHLRLNVGAGGATVAAGVAESLMAAIGHSAGRSEFLYAP